jgi:ribosome-binding ATPase YchF (GTP1/OBG family)
MQTLEGGLLASKTNLNEQEKQLLKQLNLLTFKPMFYVLNRKSDGLNIFESNDERANELKEFLRDRIHVELDAAVEHELQDVSYDDAQEFRREFGILESGVDAMIRKGYELLDLISFFTTGEKESRSWTIRRGTNARDAGAVIHTDFRDKFIRAEVIEWDKLLQAGSRITAREKGLIRTEGKEYTVQDGDVIEFLHS